MILTPMKPLGEGQRKLGLFPLVPCTISVGSFLVSLLRCCQCGEGREYHSWKASTLQPSGGANPGCGLHLTWRCAWQPGFLQGSRLTSNLPCLSPVSLFYLIFLFLLPTGSLFPFLSSHGASFSSAEKKVQEGRGWPFLCS